MTVYYLPGCKYKELHALSSQKIRTYLRAKPDHVIADCCKKSQSLFHDGDTVLTNCSSCAIITDEASPQANEMSIYEYLLADEAFLWPDYRGEEITVQDCYRAAHKPAVQKAQMSEWVKQYRTDRVVVYCNSCLKGVQLDGADGVHLLELITADLP